LHIIFFCSRLTFGELYNNLEIVAIAIGVATVAKAVVINHPSNLDLFIWRPRNLHEH